VNGQKHFSKSIILTLNEQANHSSVPQPWTMGAMFGQLHLYLDSSSFLMKGICDFAKILKKSNVLCNHFEDLIGQKKADVLIAMKEFYPNRDHLQKYSTCSHPLGSNHEPSD